MRQRGSIAIVVVLSLMLSSCSQLRALSYKEDMKPVLLQAQGWVTNELDLAYAFAEPGYSDEEGTIYYDFQWILTMVDGGMSPEHLSSRIAPVIVPITEKIIHDGLDLQAAIESIDPVPEMTTYHNDLLICVKEGIQRAKTINAVIGGTIPNTPVDMTLCDTWNQSFSRIAQFVDPSMESFQISDYPDLAAANSLEETTNTVGEIEETIIPVDASDIQEININIDEERLSDVFFQASELPIDWERSPLIEEMSAVGDDEGYLCGVLPNRWETAETVAFEKGSFENILVQTIYLYQSSETATSDYEEHEKLAFTCTQWVDEDDSIHTYEIVSSVLPQLSYRAYVIEVSDTVSGETPHEGISARVLAGNSIISLSYLSFEPVELDVIDRYLKLLVQKLDAYE